MHDHDLMGVNSFSLRRGFCTLVPFIVICNISTTDHIHYLRLHNEWLVMIFTLPTCSHCADAADAWRAGGGGRLDGR